MKAIYPAIYAFTISIMILIVGSSIGYKLLYEDLLNFHKISLENHLKDYINLIKIYEQYIQKNQNIQNFFKEENYYQPQTDMEFIYIQKNNTKDTTIIVSHNLPDSYEFFDTIIKNKILSQELKIKDSKYFIKIIYFREYVLVGGMNLDSIHSFVIRSIMSVNFIVIIFIILISVVTYYISKNQLEIPFKNLTILEEKIKHIIIKLIHNQMIQPQEIFFSIKDKPFPPLIKEILLKNLKILTIFSNSTNIFINFSKQIFTFDHKEQVYKKLHSTLNQFLDILHITILELNFSTNRFEKIYESSKLNLQIKNEACVPSECIAFRTNQIELYKNLSEFESSYIFTKHISEEEKLQDKIIIIFPIAGISKVSGIGILITDTIDVNLPKDLITQEQYLELLKNQLQIYFNIAGIVSNNISILETYKNMAITDPLTNLYNRRYLIETLTTLIYISERSNSKIAILMIDIDNFKNFNDEYGHETGDEVLKAIAKTLKMSIRRSDIVGRFGGEEFIIILPNTNKEQAYLVAEKIRKNVEDLDYNNFNLKNIPKITISIGLSIYPMHGYSHYHLIRKADEALYQAKKTGKNKTIIAEILPYDSTENNQKDIFE